MAKNGESVNAGWEKIGNLSQRWASAIALCALAVSVLSLCTSAKFNRDNAYLSLVNARATGCHNLYEHYRVFSDPKEIGKPLIIGGKQIQESTNEQRAKATIDLSRQLTLCIAERQNVDDLKYCISTSIDNQDKWKVNDDISPVDAPGPHEGERNHTC